MGKSQNGAHDTRPMRNKLFIIIFLSILLRILAALYLGDEVTPLPGISDQVSYHNLAIRALDGHGFSFGEAWWPVTKANAPTAHWSFLYTGYLMGVYTLFGVKPLIARLIQAVIVGALHPCLAYLLTKRIIEAPSSETYRSSFFGESAPLLAAGITAIYIYFIYYAAALMTEAFYITTLLGCLALAIALAEKLPKPGYQKWAVTLGFVLLATVLFRQLFLLIIPFIFLWILAANLKHQLWRQWIASGFISTAVVIAGILPFTMYNFTRFDRFVLLNTNAGYAFYWGNHPIYGDTFIPASEMGETYQDLIPDELRHLDEAALDNALLQDGLQFVFDDPERYLSLSLSRIPIYFRFLPEAGSSMLSNISRVGSFGLFLPFMIFGAARLFIPFRRKTTLSPNMILLYLFVILYTTIHALTWTQVRYRMPVDAVLVLFAAMALAEIGGFFWKNRRSPSLTFDSATAPDYYS